jgi:hypothetical protein
LKGGFGSTAISIYWAAQLMRSVGRALRSGILDCPANQHAIASGSLVCESSSLMLISPQRYRLMPDRVRKLVAYAHLTPTSLHQAHSYARTRRPCPSRRSLSAFCPIRVRKVLAHADLIGTASRQAHSRAKSYRACPSGWNVIASGPIAFRLWPGLDSARPTGACSGRRFAPTRSGLF